MSKKDVEGTNSLSGSELLLLDMGQRRGDGENHNTGGKNSRASFTFKSRNPKNTSRKSPLLRKKTWHRNNAKESSLEKMNALARK